MTDPTLIAAATAGLEATINTALQYDPATKLRLQALAGKSLAIEISELQQSLCIHFDEQQIRCNRDTEAPTTRLVGSLPGLINLALGEQVNLADSDVQAWGNTALLSDIKTIASDLDIDWEEAINAWMGDVLGHQLAEKIRLQMGWLKHRSQTGKRLISEFMTEELRAIPSASELKHFSADVDQLRLAADRAAARLQRLTQKLSPQKPTL